MIAAWMVYALVVTGLLALAAAWLEPVAAHAGQPRRTPWLAAMGAAVAWPAIALGVHSFWPGAAPRIAALRLPAVLAHGATVASAGAPRATVDEILLIAWLSVSLLLLVRLGVRMRTLARRRAAWESRVVDGTAVRVAPDVGPALVGVANAEIVVPRWALELDAPLRALVLRHESEHRAARDPLLLVIAAVTACAIPWNLPFWWCARRLRLAMELDCDRNVLQAHPDSRRYGMLLLTVAQRHAGSAGAFAPMLSEPRTNLELRIRTMLQNSRPNRIALAAAACGALLALGVACSVESPDTPASAARRSAQTAPPSIALGIYNAPQVDKAVSLVPTSPAPAYPAALRKAGVGGEVVAQFVVGEDGSVDMSTVKMLKSDRPELSASVHTWLTQARFNAAQVHGKPVKELMQMPFEFQMNH